MEILQDLIPANRLEFIANSIKQREEPRGDRLVPKSFSAYALPETEHLLLDLTPVISKHLGKELYPTYSYCRIYHTGATMRPHTDRPACEYSMSLCLSGESWPLWFQLDKPTPLTLQPGQAVLYKGLELTHWREEYFGTGCTHTFLHWVDATGSYANWKFDRRPNIGTKESDKLYWGKS